MEALKTPVLAPRYLKLQDVANYFSVSLPQVYSLVRAGDLPAIKIGGRGTGRSPQAGSLSRPAGGGDGEVGQVPTR